MPVGSVRANKDKVSNCIGRNGFCEVRDSLCSGQEPDRIGLEVVRDRCALRIH